MAEANTLSLSPGRTLWPFLRGARFLPGRPCLFVIFLIRKRPSPIDNRLVRRLLLSLTLLARPGRPGFRKNDSFAFRRGFYSVGYQVAILLFTTNLLLLADPPVLNFALLFLMVRGHLSFRSVDDIDRLGHGGPWGSLRFPRDC
jgi:hypothetical protein